MQFESPLQSATLIRRYKRFLADLETPDGELLTVHCPNTGAMTGCSTPGSTVWYSTSANPKRKYPNTLEIIEPLEGRSLQHRVGINPGKANAIVEEALGMDRIESLRSLSEVRREVAVPDEAGRFDFGFVDGAGVEGFIEVKSVTLCDDNGIGAFPDAVSERALRHVQALLRRVSEQQRGVLLFCVQHTGISQVRCAAEIYPEYAEQVAQASEQGVEVLAYRCAISPDNIELSDQLPVLL